MDYFEHRWPCDPSATLRIVDAGYDVEADSELARFALCNPREQQQVIESYLEPDLLVLDDLFLERKIRDASAELLQTILLRRYKLRRGLAVTSNRVVQDWGKYLGGRTMSTTIPNRLMHRCMMLEFEGRSYRPKEAAAKLTREAADTP